MGVEAGHFDLQLELTAGLDETPIFDRPGLLQDDDTMREILHLADQPCARLGHPEVHSPGRPRGLTLRRLAQPRHRAHCGSDNLSGSLARLQEAGGLERCNSAKHSVGSSKSRRPSPATVLDRISYYNDLFG